MIRFFWGKSSAIFTLCCVASVSHAQICNSTEIRITPDSRYDVLASSNGNEVRDNQTNLVWQRCSIGQRWDGRRCKGKAVAMSWSEAKNAAQSVAVGYRLPSIAELQTLSDRNCYNAAINETIFPNTQPDAYWSATPSDARLGHAWSIDFYYGMRYQDDRGDRFYVRPVRNVQP